MSEKPSFMDTDFMNIVNEVNEEFKNTEVFSSWMPPDGEHTVIFGEVVGGKNDKNQNDVFIWTKLPCTLISPTEDLSGKEFALFYTSKFMQNLKRDAGILANRKVEDMEDAIMVLASAQGWVGTVSIERGMSKAQKPYTGTEILEVQDRNPGTEEAVTEEATS